MAKTGSLVLRRFVTRVLFAGCAIISTNAFASCGEPGRPPCDNGNELSRVEVVGIAGQFIPGDVWCGGSCDPGGWEPTPENYDGGGGGGDESEVVITPIPDVPSDNPLCRDYDANITNDAGGGRVRFRLCPVGDGWVFDSCRDFPAWGPTLPECYAN